MWLGGGLPTCTKMGVGREKKSPRGVMRAVRRGRDRKRGCGRPPSTGAPLSPLGHPWPCPGPLPIPLAEAPPRGAIVFNVGSPHHGGPGLSLETLWGSRSGPPTQPEPEIRTWSKLTRPKLTGHIYVTHTVCNRLGIFPAFSPTPHPEPVWEGVTHFTVGGNQGLETGRDGQGAQVHSPRR